MAAAHDRPPVSVILPFHGDAADAAHVAEQLGRLELRAGDELLVVDNNDDPAFRGDDRITAIASPVKRSAYAARNVGAEHASNDWLLFIDADCRVPANLLDRYFDRPPSAEAGAVAGQIAGAPDQPGLVPAYMRSRNHLNQEMLREHLFRPMAVTANLLVRARAFHDLGGFAEQTLSGADADFCWRLQDTGWMLDLRTDALVEHVHRSDLRALLVKSARDGAGGRWLSRRWPQYRPHPPLGRELVRGPGGALLWLVRGRPRRAAFKLIDLLFVAAAAFGSLRTNATPTAPAAAPRGSRVAFVAEFPPSVNAGFLEALRRSDRAPWTEARTQPVRFAEDDGPLVQWHALVRLAPWRVLAALPAHGVAAVLAAAPAARRVRRGAVATCEPDAEDYARVVARLAGLQLQR